MAPGQSAMEATLNGCSYQFVSLLIFLVVVDCSDGHGDGNKCNRVSSRELNTVMTPLNMHNG